MTNVQETVLTILEEICGTDAVREDLNLPLFDEGLLDSFGSVALLVEIESRLGITVGISDFDRDQWATPQLILDRLAELQ